MSLKPLLCLSVLIVSACNPKDDRSYTLYRTSLIPGVNRVHVATFDAATGDASYNQENCLLAAKLFQDQPRVEARFWCEAGHYKG